MAAKKKKEEAKPKKRRRSTGGKVNYKDMMIPLFTAIGAGFVGEMVNKGGKPLIPHIPTVGLEGTYGPIVIGFGALSKGKNKAALIAAGTMLTGIGINKLGAKLGKSFVAKRSQSVSAGWMGDDEEISGALNSYDEPMLLGEGDSVDMFGDYGEFEPDENYYNMPADLGFEN